MLKQWFVFFSLFLDMYMCVDFSVSCGVCMWKTFCFYLLVFTWKIGTKETLIKGKKSVRIGDVFIINVMRISHATLPLALPNWNCALYANICVLVYAIHMPIHFVLTSFKQIKAKKKKCEREEEKFDFYVQCNTFYTCFFYLCESPREFFVWKSSSCKFVE